jgi:hypothetical protein
MKINKFKNIDKENANYWKSEFESHNPKICNPLAYSLAKNLLNYGFEADNACYGNDLNHRLDFGYKGLEISIFIPNAKFTNLDKEEFASYSWQIEGENISLYSYDIDNGHFILTTEQLLIDSLLKALQEIDNLFKRTLICLRHYKPFSRVVLLVKQYEILRSNSLRRLY